MSTAKQTTHSDVLVGAGYNVRAANATVVFFHDPSLDCAIRPDSFIEDLATKDGTVRRNAQRHEVSAAAIPNAQLEFIGLRGHLNVFEYSRLFLRKIHSSNIAHLPFSRGNAQIANNPVQLAIKKRICDR